MLRKPMIKHVYIYTLRSYNITHLNTVLVGQKTLQTYSLTITCQNSHSLHERESLVKLPFLFNGTYEPSDLETL